MTHVGFSDGLRAIRRSIVLLVGFLLVAPTVSAGTSLWLYPKDDGPRQGGHVVPPGPFTLVIENRGNGSGDTTAYGVQLVIAVADPADVDTIDLSFDGDDPQAVDLGAMELGTPSLLCSEKPMPRHGVYPAFFALVSLFDLTGEADLEGGERVEIEVTVEGLEGLRVHFDAIATGIKTTGQGQRCFDVSNPAGHDVTVANRPGGGDDCGHVKIKKTAESRHVEVGETAVFMIEVVNRGSCELTETILEDHIPVVYDDLGNPVPAFIPTGATDPWPDVVEDELLQWHLEQGLAIGESATVLLEVQFHESVVEGYRVLNRACFSAAELKRDRCATAVVMVGDPYCEGGPAGPGFWCHAGRFALDGGRRSHVNGEELQTWLDQVNLKSEVFSEDYEAATIEQASRLLCNPQAANGAADRLARHLLTLWLNVESGRLDPTLRLGELREGDEVMPDATDLEMTVGELLETADAALADENTDPQMLVFWSEVIDAVNNSMIPGSEECTEPRTASSGRMGGGRQGGKVISQGVHR